MKTPLLTIIVPIYNVEKYLSMCIDSILQQTFTDFELILVDDGSPDNCGRICDEYGRKDARIIVIHKKNGGVSSARNRALDIAKGDYITFVDSDDRIGLSTTYEDNMNILKTSPQIDILQYPIYYIFNQTEIKKTHQPSQYIYGEKDLFLNWYTSKPITGYVCDKIFKRKIFDKVRFPENIQLAEDSYCIVDFVKKAHCLYISELGYYGYYQRADSAVARFSPKKCLDLLIGELRFFKFLCTLDNVESEYCHYFFYLYKAYLDTLISFRKKIDLKEYLNFIETHIPPKESVKLDPDLKNKFWYFLFSIFGIRGTSVLYVNFVLLRLKVKDKLQR